MTSNLSWCPTGSSCDFGPPVSFADRSQKIGAVSLARCRRCGLGLSLPRLNDVGFLYSDRSSQDFQPTATGLARRIKTIAFAQDARRLVRQIGVAPKRVLDFGCGSGLFTSCLAKALKDSTVIGSDFHEDAPKELGPQRYISNDRLSECATFDLVLAMHVIEHDDDPVALIRRIAAYGRPGATMVIEVPNIDCVWASIFGTKWDPWYMPYHRVHFNRQNLTAAAKAAGLSVIREIDICAPALGRSIANIFNRPNSLAFLMAGAGLHPLQWGLEKLSGHPSALRLICRT